VVTFVNVVDKSTHADMVCRLVEYFGLLQGNLLDGNCSEISNITVQPALSGFLLSHARGKLLIMVELYYTWFLHKLWIDPVQTNIFCLFFLFWWLSNGTGKPFARYSRYCPGLFLDITRENDVQLFQFS
jgi:uncharacterized membrane protein